MHRCILKGGGRVHPACVSQQQVQDRGCRRKHKIFSHVLFMTCEPHPACGRWTLSSSDSPAASQHAHGISCQLMIQRGQWHSLDTASQKKYILCMDCAFQKVEDITFFLDANVRLQLWYCHQPWLQPVGVHHCGDVVTVTEQDARIGGWPRVILHCWTPLKHKTDL